MMRIGLRLLMTAAFFLIIAIIPLTSLAAEVQTCDYWVGKAVSVEGDAEMLRAGETLWRPVKFKDTFCAGDMLRVLKRSRADIVLANETILRLDQNTTIIFSRPRQETTFFLELISGIAHFFSRFRRSLTVATPFVNASVEGTEFLVDVSENKTLVSVFEGRVTTSNTSGSVTLTAGQSAEAEAGRAPVARHLVRPLDAVQWMLYYPPVFYYRPAGFEAAPPAEWQEKIRKSVEFYQKGDLRKAFESIETGAEDIRDSRFFDYRASLLLSVGRVDEAKADIEKALSLDPS
ncbi:MAG: FecR domain-containing protein, partial [Nitrospirota bacterium]|nr:FecR domain-containing protein [Nitrospirota bacterium]